MARKKTEAEFDQELAEVHPTYTRIGPYINSYTKVLIGCEYGHQWNPLPINLINKKSGCPHCCPVRTIVKTHGEFEQEMKQISPSIELLGTYTTNKGRILCRCRICQHQWSPVASKLQQKRGCPQCAKQVRGKCNAFPFHILVSEIVTNNPQVREVLHKCPERPRNVVVKFQCGHIKSVDWQNLRKGHGCWICARKMIGEAQRKPKEQFLDEMAVSHVGYTWIGPYVNSKIKGKVICPKQHEFWIAPVKIQSGQGCPVCARTISKGEINVRSLIESFGVHLAPRKKVGRFFPDIIVCDRNIIIEYNGVYWHSTKYLDQNYHINKTLEYYGCGYSTIHIWEDEWLYENERIVAWLKYALGLNKNIPKEFGKNRFGEFDLCWMPYHESIEVIPPRQYWFTRGNTIIDGCFIPKSTRVTDKNLLGMSKIYSIFDCGSYIQGIITININIGG